MKPILEIRHVSKKYAIQAETPPYLSLRESLATLFRPSSRKKEFWALDDLTFNVERGDTLGIIGRNGAGKSTILKILSRITPPTKGGITVRGRIASLLEVGTGFHPELTGRENIYLNGSILGMKKAEIIRQFDAILDFAGVTQFIDTPLKHYSSGMQLRLAFAVAAFLEPEVLIVDEVLAVGDTEFQKKCLGKMKDVSTHGRTVLLVSHDLTAISNLTKKTLYLKKGRMQGFGPTHSVIEQYVKEGQQIADIFTKPVDESSAWPQITRIQLKTSLPNNLHAHGEPFEAEIDIHAQKRPATDSWLSLHITDLKGRGVIHVTNGGKDLPIIRQEGNNKLRIVFPKLRLFMGSYLVSVYLSGPPNAEVYERLRDVLSFEVVMNGVESEFAFQPEICAYMEENNWVI